MKFEWDENKAVQNLAKHGVPFAEAQTVFDDPFFLVFPDPLHSQGESRYLILGESDQGRVLLVAYRERGEYTRLISAREAESREERKYEREKFQ